MALTDKYTTCWVDHAKLPGRCPECFTDSTDPKVSLVKHLNRRHQQQQMRRGRLQERIDEAGHNPTQVALNKLAYCKSEEEQTREWVALVKVHFPEMVLR